MIGKIKTYLLFGNTYCGIEHHGKTSIEAVLLQKKKNALEISASISSKNIEEVAEKLPNKQHAFLIINNDEVLTKCIESITKDAKQLLYNAFPSVSINEFYYEVSSTENYHMISMCRKSFVDNLIQTYQKHNINIIGFSLGNCITSIINDFINTQLYYTSNAALTKENKVITNVEFLETIPKQSYNINGLDIANKQLLSFAGVLSYILRSEKTIVNFETETNHLLKNFKEKRFFSQFFLFGLGFILTILLVNFFVFNSYFQEVEIMKETSQVSMMQKEKLLKLKTATDEKQKTIDDILKNATSKSSYYIDNISVSLPNTIQLSELVYQPVTKRIKKDTPILLQKNLISISGISTDSDVFSDWIKLLEKLEWITSVTVVINSAIGKNTTDFSLKINITDE